MPLDCNDSAALRVAPLKGPDPKLRNEFCPQVSLSQVRDACGRLPLVYVVLLVNVVAVLAMPPALVFLFMLANDREVMGDLVSPLWANFLATNLSAVHDCRSHLPSVGQSTLEYLYNVILTGSLSPPTETSACTVV
jgi:hypothetical protein